MLIVGIEGKNYFSVFFYCVSEFCIECFIKVFVYEMGENVDIEGFCYFFSFVF